jgi:uncharacterized membrane protein YsdA (DUF1294 family)
MKALPPRLLALGLLLAVPAAALCQSRLSLPAGWIVFYAVAISASAYASIRSDKQRAQSARWRVPEATLHFIEFAGGWPGSFLAQGAFRHKTAKASYQFVFWLIVFAHEYVAADYWSHGRITDALRSWLK